MNKFIYFGIVLFWSMSASATLIEFEGVALPGSEVTGLNPYSESGFDFNASDNNFRVLSSSHSVASALTAPTGDFGFIQLPATTITITDSNLIPFSLQSFDAGLIFSSLSGNLDIVGNLFAGGTVASSLAISNVGSTSGAFQNFSFDNSWTNLTSLDITLSSGNFLSIDNVQLNAVPIPAAVWLFASGLIGLIGIFRQKKTALPI